ncbi:MAG: GNAT family N-acetyltransferase [Geminicoccaceae bacterium]
MTVDRPILLDLPMPIVTPRLVIRPVQPGDGVETCEAVRETFDQLRLWMPWTSEGLDTPEAIEANIRQAHAEFILRKDFRMNAYERDGERLAAFSGLHEPDWKLMKFEIGYWVRASAQGHGYAAETANAMARYAFAVLGARRVEICHADGNQASRAIIRKLGFRYEGRRECGHVLPDGSIVDDHRYVLLSPDPLPALDVHWGRYDRQR